ncbi:MAG: hypothetical protein ACJ776_05005 [Chloroflexota bacterium]
MTRREIWATAIGIFLVSLVVRLVFAAQIVFPKPEDTAYYFGVARNLLEGRGLVSDALWSYATPPLEFPRPAFEVWLPLPTFLAAIPMAVLGKTFAVAQVSSVLVGAVVPVLGWQLARDVAAERQLPLDRARWVALGTGLTAAVYLPLVLNSALPDSTMPFAVIVLSACLLMTRIVRRPDGARLTDPRLLALGILIGLGAWTRNETAWLALIWVVFAWRSIKAPWSVRARAIGAVAVIALLVFAPWAYRDMLEFGSPLPGQAISNAFYLTGYDIFAWNDPPTLARHLSLGPLGLVQLRLIGLGHNLFNVLTLLGLPISVLGIVALPWQARPFAIRPLVAISLIMFLVTSLVFPAATQWGTFLHAAGPVQVLIVLSAAFAVDALMDRLGRRLGWTKQVSWVGVVGSVAACLLFSIALLPSFGSGSRTTMARYDELAPRMAEAGHPLDEPGIRLMSNFPIWVAETLRVPTLALPDEPPVDVLDLASAFPGARYLILSDPEGKHWPADLHAARPGADCFKPIALGPYRGAGQDPLANTNVYEIECQGSTP